MFFLFLIFLVEISFRFLWIIWKYKPKFKRIFKFEKSLEDELEAVKGAKDEEQSKETFSDLNIEELTTVYSPTPTPTKEIESKSVSSQKLKPTEPLSAQVPSIQSSSYNHDPSIHISLPNQVIETNQPYPTYQIKNIITKDTSISTSNGQIVNQDSTLSNPLQQSGIIKSIKVLPALTNPKTIEKNTGQSVDIYRSTKIYKEKIIKPKPSEHWNSYSVTFLKILLFMLQILFFFTLKALGKGVFFCFLRGMIIIAERFSTHILPIIWVSTHYPIRCYVINKIYKFKVKVNDSFHC